MAQFIDEPERGIKPMLRFNHMEITVPNGTLDREENSLLAFYGEIFGFGHVRIHGFNNRHVVLTTDPEGSQFLYIAEHDRPMIAEGDDHLGFLVESRSEVDRLLAQCRQWQARDPRVQIRPLDDLDLPETYTRAFYLKYLLPLWFDVQVIDYKPGFEPKRCWSFG